MFQSYDCGFVRVFWGDGVICQESSNDRKCLSGVAILWHWLQACLHSSAVDATLLRDAVPDNNDRMMILSILEDKSVEQVRGLHLSRESLDARVVQDTLPLMAHFDGLKEAIPSKRNMESVDLLALPGFFSGVDLAHFDRHQVVALLACVLLSISTERRQEWCRLVGFTLEADMLEVARRLWDVNKLKSPYEWDVFDGYDDRENVVEAGTLKSGGPLGWWLSWQAVLDILWGIRAVVVDEEGDVRKRRGKLDSADVTYLRCLMRRYGWERSGISPIVIQLELDVRQWQEDRQCHRLPTSDDDSALFKRISDYCDKDKKARCRAMRAAYPADVETIKVLKVDCLDASDDADGGVIWRSDAERRLMQSIPGWQEDSIIKASFVPLQAILFGVAVPSLEVVEKVDAEIVPEEEDVEMSSLPVNLQRVEEALAVLENATDDFDAQLYKVAGILHCTRSYSAVCDSLSGLALMSGNGDVEMEPPADGYPCMRCFFRACSHKLMLEHVVNEHGGGFDDGETVVKFRKRVVTALADLVVKALPPRFQVAGRAFLVLQNTSDGLENKLSKASKLLDCSPTFSAVCETFCGLMSMSKFCDGSMDDELGVEVPFPASSLSGLSVGGVQETELRGSTALPVDSYACSRCNFRAGKGKLILEHLVNEHGGGVDDSDAVADMRKESVALWADLLVSLIKKVFHILEDSNLQFDTKLSRAAVLLECTPTFTGVGEALSRLILCSYDDDDDVERPLQRYQCRLCKFGACGHKEFLEHIVDKHSGGADDGRALIEYRKKVIGMLTHFGLFLVLVDACCRKVAGV
eukprot:Skav207153  [mRNA]  locus=scaffold573:217434:220210:+ [translate_table: standard]